MKLQERKFYWDKEEKVIRDHYFVDKEFKCHGNRKVFYEDGKLNLDHDWKHGKFHGKCFSYTIDGELEKFHFERMEQRFGEVYEAYEVSKV